MSELINNAASGRTFHRQLLTTVSSLALMVSTGQAALAHDQDDKHPTVWIEVGAQLERGDTEQSPFAPAFTGLQAEPFKFVSPIAAQRPPRYSIGGEAQILLTPQHSDWVFSAGVRYGRSNSKRNLQHQTNISTPFPSIKYVINPTAFPTPTVTATAARYAFAETRHKETHAIVDFQAGKDVGLGIFGGSSIVSAGVRYASFNASSEVQITARPTVSIDRMEFLITGGYVPITKHNDYFLLAHATRSFHGVGPSLAWSGSAPFLGDPGDMQVAFDWGLNGAVLFGRQKASGMHETSKVHKSLQYAAGVNVVTPIYHHTTPFARSRSVVVPNVGALMGLSVRYADAKINFGYRADYFFNAMDVGIDARKTSTLGFHGPFAKISIGLGG